MAVAFVSGGTADGNAATSAPVTFSPTGGSGHDIFVCIALATNTASVSSITANGGTATFKFIGFKTNTVRTELWAAVDVGTGITSLTVNFTSSKYSISAAEYSGIVKWGVGGANLSKTQTTTRFTFVATCTKAGSYLLLALGLSGSATWSAGTNTTIDENGGNSGQTGSGSTKCSSCLARNTSTTAADLTQVTVSAGGCGSWLAYELSPSAQTLTYPAIEHGQVATTTGDTVVATTNLIFRYPTVAQNLIVANGQWHSTAGVGWSDTDGNTWAAAVGQNDSASVFRGSIEYAANIKGTSATAYEVITMTITAQPTKMFVVIYDINDASPLDQVGSASGSSTSPASALSPLTTEVNELVVGFCACETAAGSIAAGAGFTLEQTQGQAGNEFLLTTAKARQQATFTLGTSGSWACLVATFKIGTSAWDDVTQQPPEFPFLWGMGTMILVDAMDTTDWAFNPPAPPPAIFVSGELLYENPRQQRMFFPNDLEDQPPYVIPVGAAGGVQAGDFKGFWSLRAGMGSEFEIIQFSPPVVVSAITSFDEEFGQIPQQMDMFSELEDEVWAYEPAMAQLPLDESNYDALWAAWQEQDAEEMFGVDIPVVAEVDSQPLQSNLLIQEDENFGFQSQVVIVNLPWDTEFNPGNLISSALAEDENFGFNAPVITVNLPWDTEFNPGVLLRGGVDVDEQLYLRQPFAETEIDAVPLRYALIQETDNDLVESTFFSKEEYWDADEQGYGLRPIPTDADESFGFDMPFVQGDENGIAVIPIVAAEDEPFGFEPPVVAVNMPLDTEFNPALASGITPFSDEDWR